jgi:ribosomal protein S18 acetylase RimI-like enzyme
MNKDIAIQIAALINFQNQLAVQYTPQTILDHANDYLWEMKAERVIGVIRLKKVQWYQAEISHLSVHETAKRSGIGTKLLKDAEVRAMHLGACIVQCTIRESNKPSIQLFTKHGFASITSFYYPPTGNTVKIFQLPLGRKQTVSG